MGPPSSTSLLTDLLEGEREPCWVPGTALAARCPFNAWCGLPLCTLTPCSSQTSAPSEKMGREGQGSAVLPRDTVP